MNFLLCPTCHQPLLEFDPGPPTTTVIDFRHRRYVIRGRVQQVLCERCGTLSLADRLTVSARAIRADKE